MGKICMPITRSSLVAIATREYQRYTCAIIKFNGSATKALGDRHISVGYSDDKIWFKVGMTDCSYQMDVHEGTIEGNLSARFTVNKGVSPTLFEMVDTYYGYYHLEQKGDLFYIDLNKPMYQNDGRRLKT